MATIKPPPPPDLVAISKQKFGVIFTPHMSIIDMVLIWQTKVPAVIKTKYPDIDALFTTAATAITIAATARTVATTAIKAYQTVQLANETASSVITGNVTQPTTLAQSLAAKAANEAQVPLLDAAKSNILALV